MNYSSPGLSFLEVVGAGGAREVVVVVMMAKGPRSSRQHDCFLEGGEGGGREAPPITWCGMMKAIDTSHTRPFLVSWAFDLLSRGLPSPLSSLM
jgi:hypothetical protein